MTIVDSLVDTVGGRSEEQLAFRFAELLNQEALALQEAGASVIQFDEPCFNVYIDKVKDWGMAALERAGTGRDRHQSHTYLVTATARRT